MKVYSDIMIWFNTHTHTHTHRWTMCFSPVETSRIVSVPLPGFGFPPGAFEEVTLDDGITLGTRADHRLPWSVLNTHKTTIQRFILGECPRKSSTRNQRKTTNCCFYTLVFVKIEQTDVTCEAVSFRGAGRWVLSPLPLKFQLFIQTISTVSSLRWIDRARLASPSFPLFMLC